MLAALCPKEIQKEKNQNPRNGYYPGGCRRFDHTKGYIVDERVLNKSQRNEKVVKAIRLMAKVNREVYDFQPIVEDFEIELNSDSEDTMDEGKLKQIHADIRALDSKVTEAIHF